MPLLQASGLVCGYGDRAITEPLDLHIDPGEIVALIGPNGSGKSTVLKTLSGALKPLAGKLVIDGRSLVGISEREIARRVAVVPQEEAYSFRFSVRQVVAMGRLARSDAFFETPQDREVVDRCMEKADCAFLADRPITDISGGERQRTLIARALAQETPLLVMDEPTSHLDVRHVAEFVQLSRALAKDGQALILAVHDLNVALAAANRIVLMETGRQQFCGTPAELVESKKAEAVYGIRFQIHQDGDRFSVAAKLL